MILVHLCVCSETNDVNTGLLVEVWRRGFLLDYAIGYHMVSLPTVRYSNEVIGHHVMFMYTPCISVHAVFWYDVILNNLIQFYSTRDLHSGDKSNEIATVRMKLWPSYVRVTTKTIPGPSDFFKWTRCDSQKKWFRHCDALLSETCSFVDLSMRNASDGTVIFPEKPRNYIVGYLNTTWIYNN